MTESQAWLIPSLKALLKSKLFSASGAALRLLERDMSFRALHKNITHNHNSKNTQRRSRCMISSRTKDQNMFNIKNDQQNTKLSFHVNNRLKCGLKCLSNRFKSITNEIDKQWLDLTRDVFKTKCKRDWLLKSYCYCNVNCSK